MISDDLIIYFKDPFKGRLNDISILRESKLKKKFKEVYTGEKEDENFFLYGDKTYISLVRIISSFSRKSSKKH